MVFSILRMILPEDVIGTDSGSLLRESALSERHRCQCKRSSIATHDTSGRLNLFWHWSDEIDIKCVDALG